jgi:hypothetical protein
MSAYDKLTVEIEERRASSKSSLNQVASHERDCVQNVRLSGLLLTGPCGQERRGRGGKLQR